MLKHFSKDERAVSPVIGTILMVAITVVIAATVYMLATPEDEPKGKEAMSGNLREVDYGWIIDINAGSTLYKSDKLQIYNPNTGSVLGNLTENNSESNPPPMTNSNIYYIFRDNDNDGEIDKGDAIVIGDRNDYLEDRFEFRIEDTNLQLKF